MVFLFFENIQRTPSPGFAPCQSPTGVHPQAPKTPPQAPETVNPYKPYTHAQKPRETPHNAPQRKPDTTTRTTKQPTPPDTINAGHNAPTPTNNTSPGHVHKRSRLATHTRAAILDYILRLPDGGTRTKKPRHITGAVKSFIHF